MPSAALISGLLPWLQTCMKNVNNSSMRFNESTSLGSSWAIGTPIYTLGNMLVPPNPKTPNCGTTTANANNQPGVFGLSSRHPGGANVLMADGSVRFLKDSTNIQTIWALGSRDRGEIIDAASY